MSLHITMVVVGLRSEIRFARNNHLSADMGNPGNRLYKLTRHDEMIKTDDKDR